MTKLDSPVLRAIEWDKCVGWRLAFDLAGPERGSGPWKKEKNRVEEELRRVSCCLLSLPELGRITDGRDLATQRGGLRYHITALTDRVIFTNTGLEA